MNILIQMSFSDSQKIFIEECPKLLEILLSHGGVYDHSEWKYFNISFIKLWQTLQAKVNFIYLSFNGVFIVLANLERYIGEFYKESRKLDLGAFWRDVCHDEPLREMLLQPPPHSPMAPFFTGTLSSRSAIDHLSSRSSLDRLELLQRRARSEVQNRVDDEDEIFASGRMNGKREATGQRVLQVSQVLWGLSRRIDNVQHMANSKTCIR